MGLNHETFCLQFINLTRKMKSQKIIITIKFGKETGTRIVSNVQYKFHIFTVEKRDDNVKCLQAVLLASRANKQMINLTSATTT